MTERLLMRIPGVPIPQGSMRAYLPPKSLRPQVVHDNAATLKPWRKKVEMLARAHMRYRRPFTGPVECLYIFEMPRPATVDRARPSVKPDLSKLIRAIEDSMTDARVWKDDALVVDIRARQFYAPTPERVGVRVLVRDATLDLTPTW